MSEKDTIPNPGEAEKPEQTERLAVKMGYTSPSGLVTENGKEKLALCGNVYRTPVSFKGRLKEPLVVREALSALYDVVSSDFRYVPKDRTAYLAYQRLKKQTTNMNAWQARQAYMEWLIRNDPLAFIILDPIISVHPDGIFFEVFSKDEGTYAKVSIANSGFDSTGEVKYGTTNIDYSKELFQGIQRMRSYRDTWLTIGSDEVKVEAGTSAPIVEKKVNVELSWLRGFLQVQSAATLPRTTVSLNPIDLYNVLRHLRLHADKKKGGRAIRIELVPGESPRLVLEPWQQVITTNAGIYKEKIPQVVKIWGRRRLTLLQRILPLAERLELHLLGSGLPCFMVLYAGSVTFTLAMTGFTASDWTQSASFDLLLPRSSEATPELEAVVRYLAEKYVASFDTIAKDLKIKGPKLLKILQAGCQQGQLMYDLANYRLRPLREEPIDLKRLEFRNERERVAHDLIAQRAVQIEEERRSFGVGLEVTGKVTVKADKREYRPQFWIDDDGRLKKAECTCAFYRENSLKQGPCSHLIALRIAQILEEERRSQGEGKASIIVETRTFCRRHKGEEEVVQLSFHHHELKKRWGHRGENLRVQTSLFNSLEEARTAFFDQVALLEAKKYLDITR